MGGEALFCPISEKRIMKKTHRTGHLKCSGVALALLPLFSGLVLAQEARLAPVIVESSPFGAELPAASSVDQSSMSLTRNATSDTAGLLRNVPGVSLYGAGGVSSLPSIRGLADDRLRIKVDGMDLIASCPNHMNPPLSYIDPSNVDSLTVYAGITPVSLGGDSIGGTIVAESRAMSFVSAGQEPVTGGEVGAFYRSNNKARGGNLTVEHAADSFSVNFTGAWSQADNYKAGGDFKTFANTGRVGHTLALDEVGSTAYKTANHALSFGFRGDAHLVEVRLGYQDMPEQLFPNQRMDLLENEQKRLSVRYLGQFDWGSLEAQAYHERVDHFMDFGADKRFWYGSNSQPPAAAALGTPCTPIRFHGDPAGTCAAGMPMYSESRTSGARLKADIVMSDKDVLRMGAELQRYKLDDYWTASGGGMGPGTFLNINNGRRDRTALFGEWETRHTSQWLTLIGARYEHVRSSADDVRGYRVTAGAPGNQIADAAAFNALDRKQSDNNWDFAALARYTHDQSLGVEFGLARKVRSPNLYERYTWSTWPMAATMNNFVGDGNGYVGNVNLKPEKAHTLSVSFDWHAVDKSWGLRVSPFYTRVDDYIDAVPLTVAVPGQFNVLRYENQSARLYGVDISGHMPLARNALGEWGLEGVLNYTNGKNRDTGDGLYNIMPLNATVTLTHRLGGWDNALEIVGVKAKRHTSDVRNEIKTAGYGLVNLRASHNWQKVRLDFGVENLFDRHYDMPLGGAYLGQGSTMSMNGVPWGVAVPGMGRSIYVGMNVKF